MEINGKKPSDAQAKRKLLLAAYMAVAIPVSSLLWQLLSPARQLETRAWMPMRDALTPLPGTGSALTPPSYEDAAEQAPVADRVGAAPRPIGGRLAAPGRLPGRLEELLGGHRPHGAAEHAAAGRGKLGVIAGLFGGGGSGSSGHSGAAFPQPRLPMTTPASAGPLGSVGLVSAGASKRFAPARLQRPGAANGFMGNVRQSAVRLANGASVEPEFRSAASAGLPGHFASGQPEAGGAASVGGEIGMGEGNRLGDNENNSSSSLPLNPLPEVPEEVDALSGLSGAGGGRAAACEAYTQAVTETSTLLESLRAEASAGAKSLMSTTVEARNDVIAWTGREDALLEKLDKQVRRTSCKDARGVDHCEGVRKCLSVTLTNQDLVRGQLANDAKTLKSASSQLQGAPPAGESGYTSALSAIKAEDDLELMARKHINDIQACLTAADRIPRRVCRRMSTRGCIEMGENTAGMQVRDDVRRLAASDLELHAPMESILKKSWCGRFDCKPMDLSKPLEALAEHEQALQVFADVAPQELLAKTADASQHLRKAAQLLETPRGDDSRNLANGALELKRASDAMGDVNGQWTEFKNAACGTTRLARY